VEATAGRLAIEAEGAVLGTVRIPNPSRSQDGEELRLEKPGRPHASRASSLCGFEKDEKNYSQHDRVRENQAHNVVLPTDTFSSVTRKQ
jgi:hypothetical protein